MAEIITTLLTLDPLAKLQEIAVISVIVAIGTLAWTYRSRVITVITGDERLHTNPGLDLPWWLCCQCCGMCTGDWTRVATRCPLCPKRFRGSNLVKSMGKVLGYMPYSIEIKNIVVGDLPWDKRGDFYLDVACAENPTMGTSLAEGKLPKVVHFPEILTLRCRFSPFEDRVRLKVYCLQVLGSVELCEVHLTAMDVIHWAHSSHDRMKRFEMKKLVAGLERETPSWILIEFGYCSDNRDLEGFHGNPNSVITATADGHTEVQSVAEFKHTYELLDPTGHIMEEPREEDIASIERMIICTEYIIAFMKFWTFLGFLGWLGYRKYVVNCHNQMRWITMARLGAAGNVTWPMNTVQLVTMVRNCKTTFEGTGIKLGTPCRPSEAEVMATCKPKSEGGFFPEGQQKPKAFENLIENKFGIKKQGIYCQESACIYRDLLVKHDLFIFAGFVLLALLNWCCKIGFHRLIRRTRRVSQERIAKKSREVRNQMDAERKTGWF